jgi:hypothetical protein
MLWPKNSVRGSKISSIRIGARRAYKHNKRLPELRTIYYTKFKSKYQVFFSWAATSVIHSRSQEILNFSMYMLGCKVALEQDLSIGAIFRRKNYLDVPVISSTGPNGM